MPNGRIGKGSWEINVGLGLLERWGVDSTKIMTQLHCTGRGEKTQNRNLGIELWEINGGLNDEG